MAIQEESKRFVAKWNAINIDDHIAAFGGVPPLSGHFIADPADATEALNTENVLTVPFGRYPKGDQRGYADRRVHILEAVCSFGGTAVTSIDLQPLTSRKVGEVNALDADADTWTENGDSLQTVQPLPATPLAGARNVVRFRTNGAQYLGVRLANKGGGDATSTLTIHWYSYFADLGDIT